MCFTHRVAVDACIVKPQKCRDSQAQFEHGTFQQSTSLTVSRVMPALLTSTSTVPHLSTSYLNMASISAGCMPRERRKHLLMLAGSANRGAMVGIGDKSTG